jgi:DNA mismatch repair protein MutH
VEESRGPRLGFEPPGSIDELLESARSLAGRTLGELAEEVGEEAPLDLRRKKGWVGQLMEARLGAYAGSRPVPDFEELGVELKTISIGPGGKPMESTYVCAVRLSELHDLHWETSWVRKKLATVLWLCVEGDKSKPLHLRRVGRALLWRPSEAEWTTIRVDWEELTDLIRLGQVDSITAHRGDVLQIRPKGMDSSARVTGLGVDGHSALLLPRGFYLRRKFTAELLARNFILPSS